VRFSSSDLQTLFPLDALLFGPIRVRSFPRDTQPPPAHFLIMNFARPLLMALMSAPNWPSVRVVDLHPPSVACPVFFSGCLVCFERLFWEISVRDSIFLHFFTGSFPLAPDTNWTFSFGHALLLGHLGPALISFFARG